MSENIEESSMPLCEDHARQSMSIRKTKVTLEMTVERWEMEDGRILYVSRLGAFDAADLNKYGILETSKKEEERSENETATEPA